MSRRVKVPLSTARARLFELAELVRQSGDDTVVVLEHRGSREQVALVRETRLAYLETKVKEMEKGAERPFTLSGSMSSDLADEGLAAALRQIRREWVPGVASGSGRPAKKSRRTGR